MSAECLNCRHWKPTPPEGWKPPYKGAEFTRWTLRTVIGDHPQWNDGWPGLCRLHPTAVKTMSVHWCGQWVVEEEFLDSWAAMWREHRRGREIAELTAALKAARKLATQRFHLLKAKARAKTRVKREPQETSGSETFVNE